MGFFNKLDDWTHKGLSKVDDFVNEEIPGGWYTVAAMAGGAGYGSMGGASSGASGAGGFSFLPSGEMTVYAPEASSAGGLSDFFSGLFKSSTGNSGEFIPDLSGQSIYEDIGIDPDSSVFNVNDPIYDPAEPYYDYKYEPTNTSSQNKQKPKMPDFGSQSQQQLSQQLGQLNQGGESGGMRKGQAIPTSVLASLLDPKNAVKAYRPTLL